MYKLIEFQTTLQGFKMAVFTAPSGRVKKRVVTQREYENILSNVNDPYMIDDLLYRIA